MTREEYVAKHGVEPHDEKYWGSAGVQIDARWGMKIHMRRGCEYAANTSGRKISVGRKARGYASMEDGRL